MGKNQINKSKDEIGILTFHNADNYGSVLQAYALLNTIKKITENSCSIINYSSDEQKGMYEIYLPSKGIKNHIKNLYIFLFQKKKRIMKKKSFEFFRTKYLDIDSEKDCIGAKDIENMSIVVCGSDQIWNIHIKDFKDFYMLSELSNVKKISYAASMGGIDLNLTECEKKQIYKYLSDFSAISVRENVAQKMLRGCDIDVEEVLIDPTFLISKNQWKMIMSKRKIKEKYIFFYSVDYNEDSVKIAQWYGKKFHMPVVIMYTSWHSYFICKEGIQWSGCTDVEDFLSLIYYSEFILSGSFHGTVFSIIFNKPFYRIQKKYKDKMVDDDRIHTLFSKLKIENREINIGNYKSYCDKIYDIDFKLINQNINNERERSLLFLKKAFENS